MKEKYEKMHFFSKIFGYFKKKQYLCTRFRERKCAGCSSARLECLLWEQEVVSSNLAIPTNQKRNSIEFLFFFVATMVKLYNLPSPPPPTTIETVAN